MLGEVFPVDLAAYGLDEAVPAGQDGELVRAVARLFDVRLHVLSIPGRLAPATEPGLWMRGETRPAVLLPHGTGDYVRREQLFLAGVLAGRVAVHGVLFDASRIAPTTEREIAYLIDAARVVFMDATPLFEGAVFDDLRTRLMRANIHRDAVIEALESLDTELDLGGAAQLLDVASARCGILAAVDPAIAIQGLRDHATLFARGPLDAVRAIPYAVSESSSLDPQTSASVPMSITAVTLTCPHCAARYRVRIDLDKLRKVRSQAQCSHCGNTFDMSTAYFRPVGWAPNTGAGNRRTGNWNDDAADGDPFAAFGCTHTCSRSSTPPSVRTRRATPVRSRTPAKPLTRPAAARPVAPIEPAPVVSVLPSADSLGQEESPQPLVLSDIPAATSDVVLDTLPSGDWLGRALLPIERLQREPSTGEVALERLLGD